MNDNNKHIDSDFFSKASIPFKESKEEIWEKLSNKLTEAPKAKTKVISMTWFKLAAAVLILLVAATFFMKFYTTTIESLKGEHLAYTLPDGSIIDLNAASSISYHPYWWNFNREVELEGEAFFEVEKGSNFAVVSENGKTEVLGTSFNIFSRNSYYNVFCKTGKVRVSSTKTDVELIINPGEMAIIDNINNTGSIQNTLSENILGWKSNKFNFTSMPLANVIDELERQYNVSISIEIKSLSELLYTGYFTKTTSIESTLDLICQSFDITFVKLEENKYKVLQNK